MSEYAVMLCVCVWGGGAITLANELELQCPSFGGTVPHIEAKKERFYHVSLFFQKCVYKVLECRNVPLCEI